MERVAIEFTKALLSFEPQNRYVLFFSRDVHPDFYPFTAGFEPVMVARAHEVMTKHYHMPPLIAKCRLDFMHFPVFPPPWRVPCPAGWTLPDATPWLYPHTMKFSSRSYYRIFGARAAKCCRWIVTDTLASKLDVQSSLGISPHRVRVLYPGIAGTFGRYHHEEEFEQVRKKYALPRQFILFVGTLEPRKNLPRILQALRMLKAERQFAPGLVIAGRKGWINLSGLDQLLEGVAAGQVHLTGHIPDRDLISLYNMARLVVFPSLYEGFGLPALVAMACGCPVVTSNRGALLEVTGGAAVYCDPEDARSIAEGILRANSDDFLRSHLIALGLRRAAHFSWHEYARQFLIMLGLPGTRDMQTQGVQSEDVDTDDLAAGAACSC